MGRFLVTGAAGFIGSAVSRLLLEEGNSVVGVDNLNDSCDLRLKNWRIDRIRAAGGSFEFHQLDICRRREMAALFGPRRLDAVINLAARAGVRQSVIEPLVYFETNLTGTLNLLGLCCEHHVKKFVLASSSSLYGDSVPPFVETQSTDRPLSPYAASKKAAEALCFSYHWLHGLDVTVLRYFTVFGPAGRPDMSPFRFVQGISEGKPVTVYGDGAQTRDFTYVDDVARGTILGLRPVGYEVFNLGGDQPIVLMDFIRLIEKLTGNEAKIKWEARHAADPPATRAAIGKARKMLGWSPRVRFEDGVEALVQWYRRNREWASQIDPG